MRLAIVHYHLNIGGVSRVIELNSDILHTTRTPHVILTGMTSSHPQHHQVLGLGYAPPTSKLPTTDLANALRNTATAALGAPPDIWHFHNHSLGKNPAFTALVAHLAEMGEHLVLHLHDLAENGRPANHSLIARYPKIYPFAPRIHYAFLNSRDRNIFTMAGLPEGNSSILPNPIQIPQPATPRRNHSPPHPILFAPIRGIRRKNLGELVLLAALAPTPSQLAISRAPLDPTALATHEAWRHFAHQHAIPIHFDVTDRLPPAPDAPADFSSWIDHATHFVTTSVEEGFGLSFLEAIAHRKPLIGRDLPHITSEHSHLGIQSGRLYQKILIPADWIKPTTLAHHITTTLEQNHRLFHRRLTHTHIAAVMENLTHHGLLDFANLPETLQQSIIEKILLQSNRHLPQVLTAAGTLPLTDWLTEAIANTTPTAQPEQLTPYSTIAYQKKLTTILDQLSRQPAATIKYLDAPAILTTHLTPANFHFLLSAPESLPQSLPTPTP